MTNSINSSTYTVGIDVHHGILESLGSVILMDLLSVICPHPGVDESDGARKTGGNNAGE